MSNPVPTHIQLYVFATNSFELFQNQIILFALILKVITCICNETIFHLIAKSTLAKLCGVGIVYLIFLLTEIKCHDSWRNVFLSSTMINKMLDKWHLTENLTVWELWYFKAVTSYRGERFQIPTRLTTVTCHARPVSIKWILLAIRNFHSPLGSWRAVVSHTALWQLINRKCYESW